MSISAPASSEEPDYKPQSFEYTYGVFDEDSNTNFYKVESQDESGKVVGSYKVTSFS